MSATAELLIDFDKLVRQRDRAIRRCSSLRGTIRKLQTEIYGKPGYLTPTSFDPIYKKGLKGQLFQETGARQTAEYNLGKANEQIAKLSAQLDTIIQELRTAQVNLYRVTEEKNSLEKQLQQLKRRKRRA